MTDIRADKNSGFRVGYPKKPETRSSGSGRVGLLIRVFSGQKTRKKLKIRVGSGFKNSGFLQALVGTSTIYIPTYYMRVGYVRTHSNPFLLTSIHKIHIGQRPI